MSMREKMITRLKERFRKVEDDMRAVAANKELGVGSLEWAELDEEKTSLSQRIVAKMVEIKTGNRTGKSRSNEFTSSSSNSAVYSKIRILFQSLGFRI